MKRLNACDLDRLIEKHYGREFGIPEYMEGQKILEISKVGPIWDDQKEYVENFKAGLPAPQFEEQNLLEALVCDLCSKGEVKPGKYLICFDD